MARILEPYQLIERSIIKNTGTSFGSPLPMQ